MDDSLCVAYTLTEADLVSAGKLWLTSRRKGSYRRWSRPIALVMLVCAGAVAVVLSPAASRLLLAGVLAVVVLGAWQLESVVAGWSMRRQFGKLTVLHGRSTLECAADGLQMLSAHVDSRLTWQVLERFAENDRVFVLVQQAGKAFFTIPKSDMTAEQVAGLRFLFETHITRRT